jgi:chorismate synthase
MLRFLTAGESHGRALTAIVEGFPAGVSVDRERINAELRRRQSPYGRGGRMKIERDAVEILSGVRAGLTLGSPITLQIKNLDWENWQEVMSSVSEEIAQDLKQEKAITRPRPGHADLAGGLKYRQRDLRNVLERASARETAIRVAAGTLGRILIEALGCRLFSHVVQIGNISAPEYGCEVDYFDMAEAAAGSPVGCADSAASLAMIQEIDAAGERGDTLGGIFEVICIGFPPGLGSYVHWDRRLDTRLTAVVMGIPAVKGVEIGLGFRGKGVPGSEYHDSIYYEAERGFYRITNRAGGLEGGVTNGEPIILRAVVKPIPTLRLPLASVDLRTKKKESAAVERSDICVVPSAAVIGEAMAAWVLAEAVLEKFGGDTLEEIRARWEEHIKYIQCY